MEHFPTTQHTEEERRIGPAAILARRYVPELQELLTMRTKVTIFFITVLYPH